MVKCLDCGNTSNFNVWVEIKKIMEIEFDDNGDITEIIGDSEDEELLSLEEFKILDDDINFAMVCCAWCGSKNVIVGKGKSAHKKT